MTIAEIEALNQDEFNRLFELYASWCQQYGMQPKADSFQIWLEERD